VLILVLYTETDYKVRTPLTKIDGGEKEEEEEEEEEEEVVVVVVVVVNWSHRLEE
jgi:hypothetical protein